MFFDRLSEACSMHGTSPSAVAIQIGRSKSNVTGWKKGQIPSSDTVTAIADVLQVPTDFLLERPPFDCWELINQNRKGFLHYVDIMPETLKLIWGIDPENPEAAPTEHFIRFLQNVVSEVRATEDGDWIIALKEPYTHKKNARPYKSRKQVTHQVTHQTAENSLMQRILQKSTLYPLTV